MDDTRTPSPTPGRGRPKKVQAKTDWGAGLALPKPRGPRTVLTENLIDDLEKCLAVGMRAQTACAICGVPQSNFSDWLKRGLLPESHPDYQDIYSQFAFRMNYARGVAEGVATVAFFRGMEDDPMVAEKFLIGRFGWGNKKNQTEINVSVALSAYDPVTRELVEQEIDRQLALQSGEANTADPEAIFTGSAFGQGVLEGTFREVEG